MAREKIKKNNARAERVITFIEKLIVPSGVGQGKPFKLRAWQRKFIYAIYAPMNRAGRRLVRRAVLSVGRKNGKTALIAALVLAHLVGPEAVPNGEIYSAANEREQAAIVFKVAAQMVRADEELDRLLRVVDSTKTIACYHNGSFYKAISAEAGSKHGYNPTFVIYDELAQSKDRELYDVLDTSMGAREEPLFVTISTQSKDPQHILSQLIDDGLSGNDPSTVTHLYAVPEEEAEKLWCEECDKYAQDKKAKKCPDCGGKLIPGIFNEQVWYLANPALGDFRSLEDMRTMANRAKRMPSFEASFRNLYLNQRVDAKSPLITRADWMACKQDGAQLTPGEKIYLALDLSATTDLTTLVAISAENGDRIKAWFWKPGDTIRDHETRDRVPYTLWRDKGYIEAPDGRAIDYGFVAARIGEITASFEVIGLAFDRWRIETLLKELNAMGVESYVEEKDAEQGGALRLVPWGQGFKDMAPAIDALETSVLERRFAHDGNPVLTWNFSNAVTISDPAGNRKLDKSKIRFRIDGAVATAMAIGLKTRDLNPDDGPSVYETRGIISF